MSDNVMLVDILEKIINYTFIDDPLRLNLRKGLSQAEIKSKVSDFPFYIPQEVEELYQWHDGINYDNSCQLFYYHTFLPLDTSLAIWQDFFETGAYQQDLLPLFEFEGEYYCIQCSKQKQESGKIWFIYHDELIVYDSLKMMLLSILKCYETGAYRSYLIDDIVDTIVDEQKVGEIKLKYNPIRESEFSHP